MEYQIVLSPNLNISSADFVQAWNEDTETRTKAEAQLASPGAANFNPMVDAAMIVLTNVGWGVATNAIYDLIKQVLVKQGVKKHTHIIEVKKPDGTSIRVVDIDEK
jgi:hypothetical protein